MPFFGASSANVNAEPDLSAEARRAKVEGPIVPVRRSKPDCFLSEGAYRVPLSRVRSGGEGGRMAGLLVQTFLASPFGPLLLGLQINTFWFTYRRGLYLERSGRETRNWIETLSPTSSDTTGWTEPLCGLWGLNVVAGEER